MALVWLFETVHDADVTSLRLWCSRRLTRIDRVIVIPTIRRFWDILLVPHLQLRPSIAPPLIGMPVPPAAALYRASGLVL